MCFVCLLPGKNRKGCNMQNYLLTFVTTTAFILVGSGALLRKVNYNLGSENEVRAFRKLIIAFIMYLSVDILWALMVYQRIGKEFLPLHILTILDTALMGFIPYYCFLYVAEFLRVDIFRSGLPRVICQGILYGNLFLIATSFKTGLVYQVMWKTDRWFVVMGKYAVPVMIFVFSAFLGGALLHGVIGYITHKSPSMKKRSLMVVGFIMPMIVGMILYYRYEAALCFMPSIFISILMFFLSIQDQMIFTDNLTGLYNRKKLDILVEERKLEGRDYETIMVYGFDIDDFKHINDTYGHLEGDRILRLIGDAMRNLQYRYNATAIRMGGDEFVVFVKKTHVKNVAFQDVIRESINEAVRLNGIPYSICVSIGEACCDDNSLPISYYINKADEDMYAEKKEKKMKRQNR